MIDTQIVVLYYLQLLNIAFCYIPTSNCTGRLGVVPRSIRSTRADGRSLEVETKITGEECGILVQCTARLVNCTVSYSR